MPGVLETKRAGNELATRPGQKKNRRQIVAPEGLPAKPRRLTDEQAYLAGEHWDWAMKIARRREAKHKYHGLGTLDWEGAAAIGVCEAAMGYIPERHVDFRIYARPRVLGAILDMMRASRLRGYGRGVGYANAPAVQSLATVLHENHDGRADQTLEDVVADPFGLAPGEDLETAENFFEALRPLSPLCREVFRLYYRREWTMKQIGAALGLSESRISQMMTDAVRVLRESRTTREALVA